MNKNQGDTSDAVYARRFCAKCNRVASGCVLWIGAKHPRGYGHFKFRGKIWTSHRVAWTLNFGEIPAGLHVLHRCDEPSCVNPDHLFLGTNLDNILDMRIKRREFRKIPRSAHSEVMDQGNSATVLAKKYGVYSSAISMYRKRARTVGVLL